MDQLRPHRGSLLGRCTDFDFAQHRALLNHGLRAIDLARIFARSRPTTLSANATKLYGMGLRQAVRRSTLADANERRDRRIWADFAAVLIRRAKPVNISSVCHFMCSS